jgi:hypothetical protein
MSDRINGTVCKLLPGGSCFITPNTAAFDDRSATIFCHAKALQRSGIACVMVGARLSFMTKPARFEGGKPEAFDISLLAT